MTRVEQLLRKEIGLDAASVGSSLIERAIRLRMKALNLKSVESYCDFVENSPEERTELVESVIVSETWFFRDPGSFTAFVRIVLEEWLPRQPAGPLRILSIPCSSGEEPYTLAIALLDAGLRPERFMVDAVDVSARSLTRARRAIFGKNSFRGQDLSFRDRHFRPGREGYVLDPRVCGCVQFIQDNLLSENFLSGRKLYDFIFCRNLLIYFDQPTQIEALAKLKRMLAPEGVLFAGPAELPIFLDQGFVSLQLPMAFACRKVVPGGTTRSKKRDHTPQKSPPPVIPEKPPVASRQPPPSPANITKGAPADLAQAQKLADAGQLEAAAEMCEACLREQGPSVQAYYLLGLVRDAAGDPRAGDFYRKALYLDPGHYEALWHMALLLEKNGDAAGASAYKRRAERAQKKIAPKS